jgi:hypothetical protein
LEYVIDFGKDVITEIKFRFGGESVGEVVFTYLDETAGFESEFEEPELEKDSNAALREGPGILWLMRLCQGKLR